MGLPDIDFKGNEKGAALMKHQTVLDPRQASYDPAHNVSQEHNRHILGASAEHARYQQR
jgi:hypothetical protein